VEEHARAVAGGKWLLPDANGACPQFDAGSSL
jgi:hypothetical protein